MDGLISVIIPVYNHAHTLEKSVASIIAQTYHPLEIIIVDDGSTDELNSALRKIKAETDRSNPNLILKIIHQENRGAATARNRGYKESTGEYVIFWDADTIAKPKMLERFKRQLDERPEASYAYSQFKFAWKKMKGQIFNPDDLKRYNYIDTTSLIRREALNDVAGPFDESLKRFQDWDLWLVLLEQHKIGTFVPEVFFKKIVRGRKGISQWLPSFIYKFRYKISQVQEYENAKTIIFCKHHL